MNAQITSDRSCIVCRLPMIGSSAPKRGRPQRTHDGACKVKADRLHRRIKKLEVSGARCLAWGAKGPADNGLTRRGNECLAAARQLRASLGELPQDVHADDTTSHDVLERCRRRSRALAAVRS